MCSFGWKGVFQAMSKRRVWENDAFIIALAVFVAGQI